MHASPAERFYTSNHAARDGRMPSQLDTGARSELLSANATRLARSRSFAVEAAARRVAGAAHTKELQFVQQFKAKLPYLQTRQDTRGGKEWWEIKGGALKDAAQAFPRF